MAIMMVMAAFPSFFPVLYPWGNAPLDLFFLLLLFVAVVKYRAPADFLAYLLLVGLIFVFAQLAPRVYHNDSISVDLTESVRQARLFLLIIVVHLVRNESPKVLQFLLLGVTVIHLTGVAANYFFLDFFASNFEVPLKERSGDVRIVGWSGNANLAAYISCGLSLAWARRYCFSNFVGLTVFFFGAILIFILHKSRTAGFLYLACWLIFFVRRADYSGLSQYVKALKYVVLPLALFPAAGILWSILVPDQGIIDYIGMQLTSVETVRVLYVREALSFFNEYRWWGGGLGTIGTLNPGGHEFYDQTSLSAHYAVMRGAGVFDSSAATLVAQLGLIGVTLYFLGIWWVTSHFQGLDVTILRLALAIMALTSPVIYSLPLGLSAILMSIPVDPHRDGSLVTYRKKV